MKASGVGRLFAPAVIAVAAAAAAPAAGAAVTIGSVAQGTSTSCSSPTGMVQATPPAGETYVVPVDGVITSFSFAGALGGLGTTTQTKLLVLEPVGGADYRVAAASERETVDGQPFATRATRLTVSPGQTIGAHGYTCRTEPAAGGMVRSFGPPGAEPPVGAIQTFATLNPGRMQLSATIEPDCDRDGLGDETQDTDLSPCPPAPSVTITGAPKDKVKTKKKRAKATFTFSANEPGASFDCVLDGKQEFKTCTSPLTVKVKKGRHTFSVIAADAGGNAGAAATDDWKVKKKKRRR